MRVSELLPMFEALGNGTRLSVFEFIYCSGNVGARPKDLIQNFGFDSGTLDFHLKKLISAKLITRKKGCGRGSYFIGETIPLELIELFNSALVRSNLLVQHSRVSGDKEKQPLH